MLDIQNNVTHTGLNAVAFTTPDDGVHPVRRVVVVQNNLPQSNTVGIEDPYIGQDVYLSIEMEPHSIATLVWNTPNLENPN